MYFADFAHEMNRFQDEKVKRDMEFLITAYCKNQNVSYKQGVSARDYVL